MVGWLFSYAAAINFIKRIKQKICVLVEDPVEVLHPAARIRLVQLQQVGTPVTVPNKIIIIHIHTYIEIDIDIDRGG